MTNHVNTTRPLTAFYARADLPIALVVGAGGMSMAIAQRLGQSHRVILASLRPDELETGQERLHELGVVNMAINCDITDSMSVKAFGETVASLGLVQTLAHVAALSPSMGGCRKILTVNLIGAARIEQTLRQLMAVGGAAIFISSIAAHVPEPDARVLAVLDAPLSEQFFARFEAIICQPLNSGQA